MWRPTSLRNQSGQLDPLMTEQAISRILDIISAGQVVAGTGLSGGGSISDGPITIINNGILSNIVGAGIGISTVAGVSTITNTGVTSAIGTTHQVSVSGATGAVTFSTPQNIHTGATPQFARIGFGVAADTSILVLASGSGFNQSTPIFNALATDTSVVHYFFKSNNGVEGGLVGVDRAAGGGLAVGSSAYATVVGSISNRNLEFATNNNIHATLDPAGNLALLTGVLDTKTGGSTTISTGVGSIRMSTANAATNTVWIPMKYNGTTYYVAGYTTNAP